MVESMNEDVGQVARLVYDQLRRLAASYLRGREGVTLQPTALVHEAYLRLVRHHPDRFHDRDHFVAVAATAMRQILTDHARRRAASKRGGDQRRVPFDAATPGPTVAAAAFDALAIDAALEKLATLSQRQARVAELMIYAGLTTDETARALEVSQSLVEKEWRRGRAYLQSVLTEGP